MQKRNRLHKIVFSLFVVWSFLLNGVVVSAQDVVTSDDLSGGFTFRTSGTTQKKKAFTSKVKRTKIQKVATTKRILKQTVTVARTKPKRVKTKEVDPGTIAGSKIATKPKEEVSRIFAGVGEYYLDKGQTDKSLEFFRESVKLDNKNADAKNGLSEALVRKGDTLLEADKSQEAKVYYVEAVNANDKNAGAYVGLAEIYDIYDDNDSALENYKKAAALDADLTELYTPIGVMYYQKDNIAEADNYLTKALAVSPDNVETQLFLGMVRYKQEKNDEAMAAFRRVLELDNNSAEGHYYLGGTLDKAGSKNDALAEYSEAVRINPNYTEAWFDLGVAHYNNKNYEEAIKAYKQTLRLKNNMGEAHANLGDVYRELKRYDEAIGSYRLATAFIKDNNELAEIYSKSGYVAGRLATKPGNGYYWKTAIENLTKALAISSDFIDYTNLGWAYYNAALIDAKENRKADADAKLLKAKENLLAAVKINQKFPATYLNLGITQTDLGEYKDAIETLKRADELRKNWIPAISELGIAYRKNNDFENAAKQFRRTTEIDSNYITGYYNLAESEFQRKNLKEAKKAYQKLRAMNTARSNYLALQLEIITSGAVKN